MSLKEIFCQDKAIGILQHALASGRPAHAYIFAGHAGVGKFKTAAQWAKMLLCENPVIEKNYSDSCSRCPSCLLFETNSHPDFEHVYKELVEFTEEGKGKKTPVDLPKAVIREFLIEKVSSRPTLSKRKVFVVSEAEKLNAASQNSLLKTLEEPPAYCTIILLCTRMEMLLPTTKSRCQIISFSRIDENRIIEKLKELGLGEPQTRYFARLAQGSIGAACQWAKLELADANLYQIKKDLVASLAGYKYADSLDIAEQILDDSRKIADIWAKLDNNTSRTDINRQVQKTLIQIIISALQDAMKLDFTETEKLTNFDQAEHLKNLAMRLTPEQSAEKIIEAYRADRFIDANVNEKLIFEQLLLNLGISDKIKV